jgi:hypothetical protein
MEKETQHMLGIVAGGLLAGAVLLGTAQEAHADGGSDVPPDVQQPAPTDTQQTPEAPTLPPAPPVEEAPVQYEDPVEAVSAATSAFTAEPPAHEAPSIIEVAQTIPVVASSQASSQLQFSSAAPLIEITTYQQAPNQPLDVQTSHQGIIAEAITAPLVDTSTTAARPDKPPLLDEIAGTVLDFVGLQTSEAAPTYSETAPVLQSQSIAPGPAFSSPQTPTVIVVGTGSEVTVRPDGTIEASSTGGNTQQLQSTSDQAPEQETYHAVTSLRRPDVAPTLAAPEIVNDKVVLSSLVQRTDQVVDLSTVVRAVELVAEQPLVSDDFPDPTGYYRMPRGDSWSDVSYVFNEKGYPTCETEQFAGSKTLAVALLYSAELQNTAREMVSPDYVPVMQDLSSSHAAEHYNGGDFDIEVIYKNGTYDYEANLAFMKKVALLRNPDGTPLVHHIVVGNAELANTMNQMIDATYGPGSRPNIVYDDSGIHNNHFHVSIDGGGSSDDKLLARSTPPNTADCAPFTAFTQPAMSYADAAMQAFGAVEPSQEQDTHGAAILAAFSGSDHAALSLQGPTPEVLTFRSIAAAPAIGEIGSPADVLHAHLSGLVQTLATSPAGSVVTPHIPSVTTTPQSETVSVTPSPEVTQNIAPLLSESYTSYVPRTPDVAIAQSLLSPVNGGTASYETAYGPAITQSDVYVLLRSKGADPTLAATLTVIAGRESGFRPGAVGDIVNDTQTPSVGLGQIMNLNSRGDGAPYRDIQQNLIPSEALSNMLELNSVAGLQPWLSTLPTTLTEDSLFEATRLPTREMSPENRAVFDERMRTLSRQMMEIVATYEPLLTQSGVVA